MPPSQPVTDGVVAVRDDLRIHYCTWGSPDAPPVMLVHGANSHLHSWQPVARRLASRYRVICPDLRGHGDSSWAADGYRTAAFVTDLRAVADALIGGPFDLVGHSLGARIAIAYAGTYRRAIRHLVVSDVGPETSREAALRARASATRTLRPGAEIRGFATMAQARSYFRDAYPGWPAESYAIQARYALRRNWAGKWVFKADPELFWMNGSAGLRDVPWLWAKAARIACPTLILWASHDSFLDQGIVDRMLAVIPDARVARVATGHYIPREDPAGFTRVVSQFLAGDQ